MIDVHSSQRFRPLFICLLALLVSACEDQQQQTATVNEEVSVTDATQKMSAIIPLTTTSEEARAEFLAGRDLIERLYLTEAFPHFERATVLDPSFAMGYLFMAGSAPTAAQFFSYLDSAELHAAATSAGEQLIVYAVGSAARNNTAEQLQALTALVSAYPDDQRAHLRLGNFYNAQQDFDDAVRHYEQAIAIDSEFATAYNALGYAHRSNGDLDNAKDAFAKYVELLPNEANPHDSYAELLMEMGQYEPAIENYRKALSIDVDFSNSYAGISVAQSLQGNTELAQEAAAEMLAAANSSGQKQAALFSAVTAHLYADDTDSAIATALQIFELAETENDHAAQGNVLEYMGDIMFAEADTEKARVYHSAAIAHRLQSRTNDESKARAERTHQYKVAMIAIIDGDIEAAKNAAATYATAVTTIGSSFERRRAHELAGFIALMDKDGETAVAELARADQTNPIVLYWSAAANRVVGNNTAAIELATRAANRNTLSANLPFVRAEALLMLEELTAT